jgi:hypothetical protein
MIYIGNTQQHLKKRMQQHFQDVQRLVLTDKRSDSFASHFAQLIPTPKIDPNNPKPEKIKIRDKIKVKCEVVWQGRPLSCVKTFGTKSCALCSRERIEILRIARETPHLAINSCTEIYGSCRHRPRFHRYKTDKPSTDDPLGGERVAGSKVSIDTSESDASDLTISEVTYLTPSESSLTSGDSPAASAAGESMLSPSSDSASEPQPQFTFEFEDALDRKLDRL